MMSGRILSAFSKTSQTSILKTIQRKSYLGLSYDTQNIRKLYSKVTLGVDMFIQHCETVRRQMGNTGAKFKEKMSEFIEEERNMVFTEDLKSMIYLSSDEKDLDLVLQMSKKFNKQNKELRFGNFVFGPVVMRLLYYHNKPDLALECFKSDELAGFFDQIITYQILLDLLFENGKYQEIVDCFGFIQAKQLDGMKYPRNVIVLVMAACYKLNSKESLQYSLDLWKELQNVGHLPMRRATTFCAGLVYNQGNPEIALEILSTASNQNYTTVRNLKAMCLVSVGRVESVIPMMKHILGEDLPTGQKHTFNAEVIDKVREAVTSLNNPELELEFNRIEELLKRQGNISYMALSEQLLQEIQPPPMVFEKRNRYQPMFEKYENAPRSFSKKKYYTIKQRPGLGELV